MEPTNATVTSQDHSAPSGVTPLPYIKPPIFPFLDFISQLTPSPPSGFIPPSFDYVYVGPSNSHFLDYVGPSNPSTEAQVGLTDYTGEFINGSPNITNITNITNIPPFLSPSADLQVYSREASFIMLVASCVIVCLGLPLTLWAISALYSLVRNGEVAPIYVINLLISDLVQFCCMIAEVVALKKRNLIKLFMYVYDYSLSASVGFMVCIALERYLVVVHPLWYRCRRTIKSSVLVCVLVWILPVVCVLTEYISDSFKVTGTILGVFFLLPLPLLIFFLVATIRALSASVSVPTEEKRRIAGMLVLVLLIYLLLFLPAFISWLTPRNRHDLHVITAEYLAPMFLRLSPFVDLFLYVFIRKRSTYKCPTCVCCCRADGIELSSVTTETHDFQIETKL